MFFQTTQHTETGRSRKAARHHPYHLGGMSSETRRLGNDALEQRAASVRRGGWHHVNQLFHRLQALNHRAPGSQLQTLHSQSLVFMSA